MPLQSPLRLPTPFRLRGSSPNSEQIEELAHGCSVSRLTAELLIRRGISTIPAVSEFIQPTLSNLPSPEKMKDLASAGKRIREAIHRHEPITIFGDYDVDGVTSSALLYSFFKMLNVPVDVLIPDRFSEGYGLSSAATKRLLQQDRKPKLVITVDCGISSASEIDQLAKAGVDTIVTDHHHVGARLPNCSAVVNPKQPNCSFPFKEMAGVGIAFYLAIAVRTILRESGYAFPNGEPPPLKPLMDFVAIGTVCDMVPLVGLNRTLAKLGMDLINTRPRPGVLALKEIAALTLDDPISATDLAFRIGPRINAAGRMESADLGFRCLTAEALDEARRLALALDRFNKDRKNTEEQMLRTAEDRIRDESLCDRFRSIVLEDPDWHSGIIGIVASKLVEKYNRPSILFAPDGDFLKGSARGIHGLHLAQLFGELSSKCPDLLVAFGGHEKAAGLTVEKRNFTRFWNQFEDLLATKDIEIGSAPTTDVDGTISPTEIPAEFIAEFERLEPHGLGNPRPLFLCSLATLPAYRVLKSKHLLFSFTKERGAPVSVIAFNQAEAINQASLRHFMLYTPEMNRFNGITRFQPRAIRLFEAPQNSNSPQAVENMDILDTRS